MTNKETELLISQWGTDPRPPVHRSPWDLRNDAIGEERATRAALRILPDLGWAFAERIAASLHPCPILKRREYRWVRAAKNLHTGGATAAKHLRDVEVVELARELHDSDEIRPVLNALLMTRGATALSVADAAKIRPVDVIEAYHDLFFNVLDRKDDLAFMRNILGHGKMDHLFISHSSLPTAEEKLLAAGFMGTIDDVLRLAGFASDTDDESEESLSRRLTRKILKTGTDYMDSPDALKKAPHAIVSRAIDMVAKSKVEQTTASDPAGLGDFVGAARGILAWKKKIVEASIEPQTHPKANYP